MIDYKNVIVAEGEPSIKECILYLLLGCFLMYGFFYFILAL